MEANCWCCEVEPEQDFAGDYPWPCTCVDAQICGNCLLCFNHCVCENKINLHDAFVAHYDRLINFLRSSTEDDDISPIGDISWAK